MLDCRLRLARAGAGGRPPPRAGAPAEAAGGAGRAGSGRVRRRGAAGLLHRQARRHALLASPSSTAPTTASSRSEQSRRPFEDPRRPGAARPLARRAPAVQVGAAPLAGDIESRPLGSSAPGAAPPAAQDGAMKTSPKALRLPYSEQNLALLSRSESPKPETRPEPVLPPSPASAPVASPRSRSRGDRIRLARARQAAGGLRRAEQQGPGHLRQAGRPGARRGQRPGDVHRHRHPRLRQADRHQARQQFQQRLRAQPRDPGEGGPERDARPAHRRAGRYRRRRAHAALRDPQVRQAGGPGASTCPRREGKNGAGPVF